MDNQHAFRRSTVLMALLLVLVLGFPGVRAQFLSSLVPTMDGSEVGSSSQTEWDMIDAAVNLTGLWGSIDTDADRDPVWTIRPSDGTMFLVWSKQEPVAQNIVYSMKPLGGSWSGVARVEPTPTSTYDDVAPSTVTDPRGDLHVAWTRLAPTGGVILHSVRVGGTWTPTLVLSGGEPSHSAVMEVVDGHVYVRFYTATAIVTVEIVVVIPTGGSDDIDPTEVVVQTSIAGNQILPR